MKKEIKPVKFVVKSNSLVEARYRLSLQESQIILWLLTKIRPDDEDFKPHKMDITEFARMIGVEVDNQYSKLRLVTRNLMRRILDIYEPEKQEWLQVSWLSSARYQKKQGAILLKFDPDLKPYLLQLKSHFTKIDITDTLKLKSVHAIRIFEILLQYIHVGEREINLDDLRAYCGIQKGSYKNYFDLKLKLVERAKTEINTKTEYEIDYQEVKESRKVVSLKWTIKKKTHFEKSQIEKSDIIQRELRSDNSIISQLVEYGFTNSQAKKIVKQNNQYAVSDALKAVDIQVSRKNVKNPKAMLKIAIEERWKPDVFSSKKR